MRRMQHADHPSQMAGKCFCTFITHENCITNLQVSIGPWKDLGGLWG